MGSGISYLSCCNNRKKLEEKEETTEKIEEGSHSVALQPSVAEEKVISKEEDLSPMSNNLNSTKVNNNEVTLDMKSRHLSSNGNFIIKVMIDFMEITYKLCDDFGNYFKPYIEILFENQKKVIYYSDDKLNNSNLLDNSALNSDANNSFNINDVSGYERQKSQVINSSTVKDRFYSFKTEEVFSGKKENAYHPIIFVVKNTNVHSHLTEAHPSVTIGEAHILSNLIYDMKKGEFEGYIRIKFKNIQEIGKLKVKLVITDKNAASSEVKNKNELENSLCLNNSLDMNRIYNQHECWEDELTNYYEIEPNYLRRYFLFESTKEMERSFIFANKVINENVYDADTLHKYYVQTLKEDNSVSLYQILNQLIKLAMYQDFNPIHDFFKYIGPGKTEIFFLIPETTIYNIYILERFMIFLYYSQKYFNSNKSLTIRNNKFWNENSLVDMIYKCVKRLYEMYKEHSYDNLFLLQVRECILWCLNNLNELLTQPISTNDSSEESRASEYTVNSLIIKTIYNNCIRVMSYRISLLKLIDFYSVDSEMMSALFRIFRKATQTITYDNSPLLDRSKIDGRPRDISKKFKILLIEKYEGLFLYSLRMMLQKYHHYPELHVNILIILFQITSFVDYKYLVNRVFYKDFRG